MLGSSGMQSPARIYADTKQLSSILASAPFSRTKQNHMANLDKSIIQDRTMDRIGFNETATDEAIIKHQDREKNKRSEGERSVQMNSMLFSGTGSFSMQQRMAAAKDVN